MRRPRYTEAAPLRRRYMECTCEAGYYEWLRSVPEQALFVEASCIEAHGTVRVTRHGPWRALWFGEVEQGLSRAVAGTDMHDPVALGFDYIATMARRAEKLLEGWKRAPFQVVAVGLGTGALPAYLAHRLGRAGARVTALELDPTVVRLARDVLKVSLAESTGGGSDVAEPVAKRQRMDGASADTVIIEVGDAAEWFAAARREGAKDSSPPLAAVLLDAYDAKGKVQPGVHRARRRRGRGEGTGRPAMPDAQGATPRAKCQSTSRAPAFCRPWRSGLRRAVRSSQTSGGTPKSRLARCARPPSARRFLRRWEATSSSMSYPATMSIRACVASSDS